MEPMLTLALRAARQAGELIVKAADRVNLLNIEEKGRNDFVTDVDRKAEQEIRYHLSKAYPEHAIHGEESGYKGSEDAEYTWIIDPLDGTTNFIHGIPHYAVSIACCRNGRVEHAVVYDPIMQEEFHASRGGGAYMSGKRIRVSNRRGMEGALIGTGIPFSGFALEHMSPYLACLEEIAGQTSGIRRPGAASLDLAYVAAGRFDGFWEMNLKPWDIAAGSLIVQESGGLVCDFKGGNDFLTSGHIVCATPKVLKPLVKIVSKHLGQLQT